MKWIKNTKFLKRLEAIGVLLTLIGLIIKFSVTDVQISKFSVADRNFDSYHMQYLNHDIKLITGIVSPGFIRTKEDFINLSNHLMAGIFYYMEGLNIDKAEKDKVIKELQKEGQKVKDNNTYLDFRNQCDKVISEYSTCVHEQYESQRTWISRSNVFFMIFTLLGSFMIFISKWFLSKL